MARSVMSVLVNFWNTRKATWLTAGLSLALLQSSPARAQAPQGTSLDEIQRRLGQQEAEIRSLREQLDENRVNRLPYAGGDATSAYRTISGPNSAPVNADNWSGDAPVSMTAMENMAEQPAAKPEPPKFPKVRLTGYFQLDGGWFDQDVTSRAQLGDIQDGVGMRRTRLAGAGSVAEFTNYFIQMDFAAAGRPSFFDVWAEQTNLPFFGAVRIGHFRQPGTLDAATSDTKLQFLERSLPFNAFVPFRRDGIMAYRNSDNNLSSIAYSIYKTGGFNRAPIGDSRFATDIGDNGGYAFGSRLTHLLWYDEPAEGRYMLHVGGSFDYCNITGTGAAGSKLYQARSIPEFFVGDPGPVAPAAPPATGTPFFADTTAFAANSFELYGVETCGQWGPANMQAEYMFTSVNRIGGPIANFNGGYIQTGYFLTGENRTYNMTNRSMDAVVPFTDFFSIGTPGSGICGWGAWEVASRVSYIDLNSGTITGGRLTESTIGLNWYLNPYTKIQFDWMHCLLDRGRAGVPLPQVDSSTNIFATRLQLEF